MPVVLQRLLLSGWSASRQLLACCLTRFMMWRLVHELWLHAWTLPAMCMSHPMRCAWAAAPTFKPPCLAVHPCLHHTGDDRKLPILSWCPRAPVPCAAPVTSVSGASHLTPHLHLIPAGWIISPTFALKYDCVTIPGSGLHISGTHKSSRAAGISCVGGPCAPRHHSQGARQQLAPSNQQRCCSGAS